MFSTQKVVPESVVVDDVADLVGREFALVGQAVVRAEEEGVEEVRRRSIACASFSSVLDD